MGRFLHPFTNFTRSERSAEKSPSFKRKEKRVVKKKREKEILLIEGFSINVSRRKGIIFSARKRPFHLFFSAIFLVPPPPSLPISRYFPVSQFEREISSNVQTCFSGGFLAAHSRDGGSDCRRDPTRGLIMHKMLPVSARRLLSRTNPYGGGFRYSGVSGWKRARPFATEKNACGGSGRTETIIYTVWRTIGSSEGRAKNGIKWILAKDNR